MSRSCGGFSVTSTPPIETSPIVTSSRPGDHPQQRRLAAAGRADEHAELALGNLERERIDGLDAVGIDLRDFVERDPAHRVLLPETSGVAVGLSASGIRSPCASGQLVAQRVDLVERQRGGRRRVEHRRVADVIGPALEHGAHGQVDDARVVAVQRRELRADSPAPASGGCPSRRRGTEPRRRRPRAARGAAPSFGTLP